MSDSVLNADEWDAAAIEGEIVIDGHTVYTEVDALTILNADPADVEIRAAELPKLIAVANLVLPASDPAKITRETIAMLRNAGADANPLNDPYESDPVSPYAKDLRALADALERYLPPE